MTDAFEAARKADEAARAKADVPKEAKEKSTKPNVSSERQGQVAQHEIRSQLQALAESKLRAVENEDFELAEKLKHQEQELQQLCPTKSWASLVVDRIPPPAAQRGSRGENTVFRRGVGMVPKAGPAPRGAPAAPPPVSGSAGGCAGGCAAAMSATRQAAGKLVFVLTAPGELTPESFKATTTHVARRDALARIATAALWRGRGLPWDDIHEIVFIFEDYRALHMSPRFVASCPVPSEYHMIMVLQRALEGTQMPGLHISAPDRERFLGGHIDDMVAQYAHSGPTSVVLLHEAYPQSLGLYDDNLRSDTAGESSKRTLLFFLGAVKDMTPEESRAVVKACRAREVPCVEANLGQHAEFTSKIIDVLHGHHLYRRLAPAVAFRARMSGSPREMVADDKKKDGQYEIPRCCISQLWCSKSEHRCHALSFVYPGGEAACAAAVVTRVLTVNPSLVTCLKLQHRAAPTERNLVSALRVASGDWRADPNLTVDEGCVVLGDAGNVMAKRGEALHPQRTALLDLEVVLLHQSGARDFPRNFRSQLLKGLFPKGTSKTWTQLAMPRALASLLLWLVRQKKGLSIHASISLLGHFWDTRALTRALEKIPGTARDYRACGFRGKVKVIYQVGDLLFKRE
ncbi:UVR domain-containing protein, partial [Durusdinium trenchii]